MVPLLTPPERVNTTVSPPVVRLLPAASLAWSVSVTALPEATVPDDRLTAEVAVETGPGVTVTDGNVEVTGELLISAPMVVAVPEATPVNDAVYVPLA